MTVLHSLDHSFFFSSSCWFSAVLSFFFIFFFLERYLEGFWWNWVKHVVRHKAISFYTNCCILGTCMKHHSLDNIYIFLPIFIQSLFSCNLSEITHSPLVSENFYVANPWVSRFISLIQNVRVYHNKLQFQFVEFFIWIITGSNTFSNFISITRLPAV